MMSISPPRRMPGPAVCEVPEAVSQEDNAATSFAVQSVLGEMLPREQQEAFVARALASRDKARWIGRLCRGNSHFCIAALDPRSLI